MLEFEAQYRANFGTGCAREIRKNKMIPTVIYGHNKENLHLCLDEKSFAAVCRRHDFPSAEIVLNLDGKKIDFLSKNVQFHPVTEKVLHVDFVFLHKDSQSLSIPVLFKNRDLCIGVKRGGFFNIVLRMLKVVCKTNNLPRVIELDVGNLSVGKSVRVSDLKLPDGIVKVLHKPEQVVVSIIGSKGKASEDAASEESTAS